MGPIKHAFKEFSRVGPVVTVPAGYIQLRSKQMSGNYFETYLYSLYTHLVARDSVVVKALSLQTGRSRVPYPMR
jgi:hypothetical protein